MAFIVVDSCIKCKLTDCVEVCPVDAIYSEDEVPEDQISFIELNAELCMEWPNIAEQKDPPEDADEWREVKNKIKYLEK